MKICRKCGQDKRTEDFHERRDRPGKTRSWCKSCTSKSNCKWGKNNKEKSKQYSNTYRLSLGIDERMNRWRKTTYGLSAEGYQRLLLEQGNSCAICRKPAIKTLSVDHDHKTKKVRGLLCRLCNAGLGIFKDDLLILESAIEYLQVNA